MLCVSGCELYSRWVPLTQRQFSEAFLLAVIFEKVSFDAYNFRITRLSARKSEQMKNS